MTNRELASSLGPWHVGSLKAFMETSESIQEILEQNAKWWDRAAVHCETIAPRLEPGKKEEWLFMSAVYRERSDIHAKLLERLRGEESGNAGDATSHSSSGSHSASESHINPQG
jgi:hypothetical protein